MTSPYGSHFDGSLCEVSDAYMCDDGADDFCMLYGPDGFCCRLGEPEDRIWIRDGRDAVDKLNEQHRAIESLRADRDRLAAEVERLRTNDDDEIADGRPAAITARDATIAELRELLAECREEIDWRACDALLTRIDVALYEKEQTP